MLRLLLYVVPVALAVYCTFDVLGSDERRRRGVPTWVWVLVVVLAPVVGGVVWLLVSRLAPRDRASAPRGPLAPDDDPEFLFRLEQERRRREAARRREETSGTAAPDADRAGEADEPSVTDDDPDAAAGPGRTDADEGTTDAPDGTPQS